MAVAYINLEIGTYEISRIQALNIHNKINEHSTLKLTAELSGEKEHEEVFKTSEGSQINVYGAENSVIFKGVVTQIAIEKLDNIYYLDTEARSNSFLMDVKRNFQSFQDKNIKYKDMIMQLVRTYSDGDVIDTVTEGATIEKFIMQYNETDWEFCRRMASHFNAGLIPSIKFNAPKFFFGVPKPKNRGDLERFNFQIKNRIAEYMLSSQNYNPSLQSLDAVEFIVSTTEEFEIGDSVQYQNSQLYIKEKNAEIKNSVLFFTYALSTKQGLSVDKAYNQQIIGLTLKGKVLEVIQDRVKVHLEIDKEQDVATAWEFPYTTLYAADGSTGFYFMPELGDTVLLNFLNREEHYGVGVNSLRGEDKPGDKILDPDTKYLRTRDGKEIKIAPDEIIITCSNAVDEETGEKSIVYIRLNENYGIDIVSTETIAVQSDATISLDAGKQIFICAEDEIKIKCKTNQIKMDEEIDIAGEVVKIN